MLISQILTLYLMVSPSLVTQPKGAPFPSLFVVGIASNRLLLRSQRMLQNRGSDLSCSSPSRGFATAAGITLEFQHGEDPHLADYSTGEGLELTSTRQEEKVQTSVKTQRIETGCPLIQSLERDRTV